MKGRAPGCDHVQSGVVHPLADADDVVGVVGGGVGRLLQDLELTVAEGSG